jgi:hypothetical protein
MVQDGFIWFRAHFLHQLPSRSEITVSGHSGGLGDACCCGLNQMKQLFLDADEIPITRYKGWNTSANNWWRTHGWCSRLWQPFWKTGGREKGKINRLCNLFLHAVCFQLSVTLATTYGPVLTDTYRTHVLINCTVISRVMTSKLYQASNLYFLDSRS